MSLYVSLTKLKERAGVSGTAFDSEANNLITDYVAAIERALRPDALADPDSGLQATLNLAALEIVAGEFCAQLWRKPGWADSVVVFGLEFRPAYAGGDPTDPSGLKGQGWERLRPWLRVEPPLPGVRSGGARS